MSVKLYDTCVFFPKKGVETGPDPTGAESQTRIREKKRFERIHIRKPV
jgi:hypothetical protein